jgi:hypothetical protein
MKDLTGNNVLCNTEVTIKIFKISRNKQPFFILDGF